MNAASVALLFEVESQALAEDPSLIHVGEHHPYLSERSNT